jgi:hypothetical protein
MEQGMCIRLSKKREKKKKRQYDIQLHKGTPAVTLYEAQANPADHEKIQGTEGAFNTPQT